MATAETVEQKLAYANQMLFDAKRKAKAAPFEAQKPFTCVRREGRVPGRTYTTETVHADGAKDALEQAFGIPPAEQFGDGGSSYAEKDGMFYSADAQEDGNDWL